MSESLAQLFIDNTRYHLDSIDRYNRRINEPHTHVMFDMYIKIKHLIHAVVSPDIEINYSLNPYSNDTINLHIPDNVNVKDVVTHVTDVMFDCYMYVPNADDVNKGWDNSAVRKIVFERTEPADGVTYHIVNISFYVNSTNSSCKFEVEEVPIPEDEIQRTRKVIKNIVCGDNEKGPF